MAKSKPKKKAAPAAKRPTGNKPAAKKTVASKPKSSAGKTVAAKKAPAKKAAPVKVKAKAKAKPAPKPVKPKKAPAKATKAAAKPVAPAKKSAKPAASAPKRPVAVSHRPQAGAVAVQPRPAKASTPTRARPSDGLANGAMPTEDQIRRSPESAYMSDGQLAFFQERLLQMRDEVLARELDVKERLHQREVFADPADRASAEEEHWLDLRLRERESLLLKKIDDALRRIRDREYGYCEKTGEPIGIARLLARPTATVCVDIKGQDERAESQYRDR